VTSSVVSTVPAPIRQLLAAERRQRADRFEGPRRVERHFEDAKTLSGQRGADGSDFLRRNAAQDGDERPADRG